MRQELEREASSLAGAAFSAPLRALVLGATLFASDAPGQEPKEPPAAGKSETREKVKALIEQLGDDSLLKREAASKELRKLVLCD